MCIFNWIYQFIRRAIYFYSIALKVKHNDCFYFVNICNFAIYLIVILCNIKYSTENLKCNDRSEIKYAFTFIFLDSCK